MTNRPLRCTSSRVPEGIFWATQPKIIPFSQPLSTDTSILTSFDALSMSQGLSDVLAQARASHQISDTATENLVGFFESLTTMQRTLNNFVRPSSTGQDTPMQLNILQTLLLQMERWVTQQVSRIKVGLTYVPISVAFEHDLQQIRTQLRLKKDQLQRLSMQLTGNRLTPAEAPLLRTDLLQAYTPESDSESVDTATLEATIQAQIDKRTTQLPEDLAYLDRVIARIAPEEVSRPGIGVDLRTLVETLQRSLATEQVIFRDHIAGKPSKLNDVVELEQVIRVAMNHVALTRKMAEVGLRGPQQTHLFDILDKIYQEYGIFQRQVALFRQTLAQPEQFISTTSLSAAASEALAAKLDGLKPQFQQVLYRLQALRRGTPVSCFIHYAWGVREQENFVARLASDLKDAGILVWHDRSDNMASGSSVLRFIDRIPDCDFVIVAGAPQLLEKYHTIGAIVPMETHLIFEKFRTSPPQKQVVIPILLSGSSDSGFPPYLRGQVYLDFQNPAHYFRQVSRLLMENLFQHDSQAVGILTHFVEQVMDPVLEADVPGDQLTAYRREKRKLAEYQQNQVQQTQGRATRRARIGEQVYERATQGSQRAVTPEHLIEWYSQTLPAVNNLVVRDQRFVGRQTVLDQIQAQFTFDYGGFVVPGQTVLTGPSGCGKRTLAREYAHRHAGQYSMIWEFNASTITHLNQSFARLAEKLGLSSTDGGIENLVAVTKAYLECHPGWLVIFSGVQAPNLLPLYLPETGGHLLVVGEDITLGTTSVVHVPGAFSRAESVEFVGKTTQLAPGESADQLAALLLDDPLSLFLAGDYIRRCRIPIGEFLGLFRSTQAGIQPSEGPQVDLNLQTLVAISGSDLTTAPPMVKTLLIQACQVPGEPILRSALEEKMKSITTEDSAVLDTNDAIKLWTRTSLVQANVLERTISIHPRLRSAILKWMGA